MRNNSSMRSTCKGSGGSDAPARVSSDAPIVDRIARSAHGAVDRAADTAGSAVGRVRDGVTDTLGALGDKVQELASSRDDWVDSCRQSVRDHPLSAVGLGLAAGYLIARLLRSGPLVLATDCPAAMLKLLPALVLI